MKDSLFSKADVLAIVTDSLRDKVVERLTSYNSPLNPVIDEVVKAHVETIREIADSCLRETLNTPEFKRAVKDGFAHRIAKSMVGKLEGAVEKAVEVLRQNPTLRAEMILAVENIIKTNQ